jgi:hypothetical protein
VLRPIDIRVGLADLDGSRRRLGRAVPVLSWRAVEVFVREIADMVPRRLPSGLECHPEGSREQCECRGDTDEP